jgi:hypothetical protein
MNRGYALKSRARCLFVFFVMAAGTLGSQQNRIRTVSTGAPEGSAWLQWDPSMRLGFIRGYLMAVRVGYRDGCFWYDDFARPTQQISDPNKSPFARCLAAGLKFSKTPEYYSDQVTAFYSTYSKDVGIPLDELLRSLSDSEGKSLDEIDRQIGSPSPPTQ